MIIVAIVLVVALLIMLTKFRPCKVTIMAMLNKNAAYLLSPDSSRIRHGAGRCWRSSAAWAQNRLLGYLIATPLGITE